MVTGVPSGPDTRIQGSRRARAPAGTAIPAVPRRLTQALLNSPPRTRCSRLRSSSRNITPRAPGASARRRPAPAPDAGATQQRPLPGPQPFAGPGNTAGRNGSGLLHTEPATRPGPQPAVDQPHWGQGPATRGPPADVHWSGHRGTTGPAHRCNGGPASPTHSPTNPPRPRPRQRSCATPPTAREPPRPACFKVGVRFRRCAEPGTRSVQYTVTSSCGRVRDPYPSGGRPGSRPRSPCSPGHNRGFTQGQGQGLVRGYGTGRAFTPRRTAGVRLGAAPRAVGRQSGGAASAQPSPAREGSSCVPPAVPLHPPCSPA
jgi:hypothetical protein